MNHQQGQLRAELFDTFVSALLRAMYPDVTIVPNVALANPAAEPELTSVSIDFLVAASEREGEADIIVETKAPYTGATVIAVRKALRHLVNVVYRAHSIPAATRVVLAISDQVSQASALDVEEAAAKLALRRATLEIWDAAKLRELSRGHLDFDPGRFQLEDLQRFAATHRSAEWAGRPVSRTLPAGKHDDVIVLTADFCSFSRFVHASGSDTDLVTSIMGRFYRETRDAISRHRGVLDKYMGDGILSYWLAPGDTADFEACVAQLVGISINLAEEWQDHIDFSVEPKGLRAGAAIGPVLFIPENADGGGPVHAIGDSINMSARLQSEAQPNTLIISNRLRTRHFADRDEFTELGVRMLKNIGEVIAWERKFTREPGA